MKNFAGGADDTTIAAVVDLFTIQPDPIYTDHIALIFDGTSA
jgi:hypothetical protein